MFGGCSASPGVKDERRRGACPLAEIAARQFGEGMRLIYLNHPSFLILLEREGVSEIGHVFFTGEVSSISNLSYFPPLLKTQERAGVRLKYY